MYYFTLNEGRNGFELINPGLSDLIVDNSQKLDSITLGGGFGGIIDVLTGPDGLLYVLSYGDGVIYKSHSRPDESDLVPLCSHEIMMGVVDLHGVV
jgi:hypothetical protein